MSKILTSLKENRYMRRLKEIIVNAWIGIHLNKEQLFTKYYLKNSWGCNESRSGIGSSLEHTERLRSQLPIFFKDYGIKSIFDAPCGDFNWFRYVQRPGINYIGADIVRPLIESNNKNYSDEITHFIQMDITKDKFPATDVWICRDVLFHLSERDIYRTLRNFVDSDIPYILTTTFPECIENLDVPTGSFRLINLRISPFYFEPPICSLIDSVETWQIRHLALWDRETVKKALMRNMAT